MLGAIQDAGCGIKAHALAHTLQSLCLRATSTGGFNLKERIMHAKSVKRKRHIQDLVLRNEFLVAFEQLETSQKQPGGFKDAFIHEVWVLRLTLQ